MLNGTASRVEPVESASRSDVDAAPAVLRQENVLSLPILLSAMHEQAAASLLQAGRPDRRRPPRSRSRAAPRGRDAAPALRQPAARPAPEKWSRSHPEDARAHFRNRSTPPPTGLPRTPGRPPREDRLSLKRIGTNPCLISHNALNCRTSRSRPEVATPIFVEAEHGVPGKSVASRIHLSRRQCVRTQGEEGRPGTDEPLTQDPPHSKFDVQSMT